MFGFVRSRSTTIRAKGAQRSSALERDQEEYTGLTAFGRKTRRSSAKRPSDSEWLHDVTSTLLLLVDVRLTGGPRSRAALRRAVLRLQGGEHPIYICESDTWFNCRWIYRSPEAHEQATVARDPGDGAIGRGSPKFACSPTRCFVLSRTENPSHHAAPHKGYWFQGRCFDY